MVVNVYERYFKADAVFSGVRRNGALVMLVSDSEAGAITYKASVTFFPHVNEEDYAISYDAYLETVLFSGKGRRSKKREASLLELLPETIDQMAVEHSAVVCWSEPLREERRA